MTPEQRARHAAAQRAWRERNPEAAKASDARKQAALKADPERLERYRARRRRYQAEWRKRHPERRRAIVRKAELLGRYGLTVEEYEERVKAQGGVCVVCGTPPKAGRRLNVDHDHACCDRAGSCGACIRGLLCDACNGGMGLLGDDPIRLEAAARYLRAYAPRSDVEQVPC